MKYFNANSLTRNARRGLLLTLLLLTSGCAVTPPRVDPYSTLLPAGAQVADSQARISRAEMKKETVYLVVGANFVTYAEVWSKFQETAEKGGFANLAYSREALLNFQAQWAPTRVTSLVVTELQKYFHKIVVVNDLAEAQAQTAKWVVMFDHAFVQPTTATATWTNTTSIDLLDSRFARVIAVSFSEHKEHGQAWGGDDVRRITRARGDDIIRCVQTALAQLNMKLAAAR